MSIISDANKIKRIEDLEEKIRFLQEELNEIKKEEGIEVKNKSTVGRKPILLKDKNNELVTNTKIFQMYNDEKKSLEEIASHCGCSRNTIRKRLPIKCQKNEEVSKTGDYFSIHIENEKNFSKWKEERKKNIGKIGKTPNIICPECGNHMHETLNEMHCTKKFKCSYCNRTQTFSTRVDDF